MTEDAHNVFLVLIVQILSWGHCGLLGITRLFEIETAPIPVSWVVSLSTLFFCCKDEGRDAGSFPCPFCSTQRDSWLKPWSHSRALGGICAPWWIWILKKGEGLTCVTCIHSLLDPLPCWLFLAVFKLTSSCKRCCKKKFLNRSDGALFFFFFLLFKQLCLELRCKGLFVI